MALLWLLITLILPVALLLAATFVKAKWSERYLLPSFGLALVVGVGTGWESLIASPKSLVVSRKSEVKDFASCLLLPASCILLAAWLTLAVPALGPASPGDVGGGDHR